MATYTVQTGDTLFQIAQRFGTTVERLTQLNNLTNPDVINVGQVLTIPETATAGVTGTEVDLSGTEQNETRRVRGLLYRLITNRREYARGEPVIITLVKTNVTNRNITLRYRTAQRFDFVVRRGPGQAEIWRWSRGRFFAQVVSTVILRPGESQTFRVTWDQRSDRGQLVPPSFYTIEGYNVAEGYAGEAVSTVIRIRPAVTPTPTPTPTPLPTPTPCPDVNVLVNPGFETWPNPAAPPTGWSGSNLFRTTLSRRGSFAAGLGAVSSQRAVLSQRVNIEPGRIYELTWWARENVRPGAVGRFILFVEIFYFNIAGNFVGRTEPRFSQENIPENIYQRYQLSTGRVPAGARIAEIRFTFEPSSANNNTVKIDDVDFRCRF